MVNNLYVLDTGSWSSHIIFSLGRMLLHEAFNQVLLPNQPLTADGSHASKPDFWRRLMTVLKRKKSTQWEKAQQRINVSPIVSRISRFRSKSDLFCDIFPPLRLVPEGKAAAVGLAFGESLFFRKLLVPVLVNHILKLSTM